MKTRYDLPFIRLNEDGTPSSYWSPVETGDYEVDCSTGRRYAALLVLCPNAESGLLYLRVTEDLATKIALSQGIRGVEIGFLTAIGSSLSGCRVVA